MAQHRQPIDPDQPPWWWYVLIPGLLALAFLIATTNIF